MTSILLQVKNLTSNLSGQIENKISLPKVDGNQKYQYNCVSLMHFRIFHLTAGVSWLASHHWHLMDASGEMPAMLWRLTTGVSPLTSHHWRLTTGVSPPASHHWRVTTDVSPLLVTVALHDFAWRTSQDWRFMTGVSRSLLKILFRDFCTTTNCVSRRTTSLNPVSCVWQYVSAICTARLQPDYMSLCVGSNHKQFLRNERAKQHITNDAMYVRLFSWLFTQVIFKRFMTLKKHWEKSFGAPGSSLLPSSKTALQRELLPQSRRLRFE